jgi:hypothetical protein
MTNDLHFQAIKLNLAVMTVHLHRANQEVEEALTYIRDGNQNAAIGSLAELPDLLQSSKALYEVIKILHRNSR